MGLLAYSGITTKVRAMEGRLLTEAQLQQMASLEDVRSAADFLKQQPAYQDIFAGLDDTMLHRGYIEQLLTGSMYRDFTSLYRFSSLSQRRFLDIYFMHYEIAVIKQVLRHLLGQQSQAPDMTRFREFFRQHSRLDPVALSQAGNMQEFLDRLEGTVYGPLFSRMKDGPKYGLFDYESRLDLFYLKSMWTARTKLLPKKEQKILAECFGPRLDLLNIQWIYRARYYYNLPEADTLALLIPIRYKLRPAQVTRLLEAPDREAFAAAIRSTAYGRYREVKELNAPDAERLHRQMLDRIYSKTIRKYPYSIAILDAYLYFKARELHQIITIIEGIRYGLKPDEIIRLAAKQ
ncbi:MAG: V-type ATPase subunit [Eubacteriales bacterium]|nr:V-type ATPase subunit [Eubacteriales bacterium]